MGVGIDQLPSDHRAVYVALRAGRQGPALGRGPWRFSLDLLLDVAYMDATKVLLDRCDATHPVIPGSAALGTDHEELKALLREEAKRHMLARSRVRNCAGDRGSPGCARCACAVPAPPHAGLCARRAHARTRAAPSARP